MKDLKEGVLTPEELLKNTFGPSKFEPKSKDDLLKFYDQCVENRRTLWDRSIPFICEDFLEGFRLCQGMVLVGALTGQAKTTTNANILAGFLKSSDKKALVISNEEPVDAIYNRVACILLEKNFNSYQKGQLSPRECERIEGQARSLMDRILIVVNDGDWNMGYLEDVQAVLEYAASNPNEYALITIDYLQTIDLSRARSQWTQYEVSRKFGLYLKNYGRRMGAPVVLFAQLKNKGTDAGEMKSRVEGDRSIINHCFDAIEVVPDFEKFTTKFVIQKSRFGIPIGTEVEMEFVSGRYVPKRGSIKPRTGL